MKLAPDRAKKAPVTRDVRTWASKPNRLDLGGFDRPEAQNKHLEARIDILTDINECSRKRSCSGPTFDLTGPAAFRSKIN